MKMCVACPPSVMYVINYITGLYPLLSLHCLAFDLYCGICAHIYIYIHIHILIKIVCYLSSQRTVQDNGFVLNGQ